MLSTLRAQHWRLSIGWAALWAALALVTNLHTVINSDNGWLLYAAKRYLAGERPYIDFLETNPPLILWLYRLPVALAGWMQVAAVPVFFISVLLLAAASLAFTLHEIKRHALFSDPLYGNIVFAALAQIALGCSVLVFGQREHLFLLFALPYVMQSSDFEREPRLNARQWIVALMAGIGFSIKPFFVLIWAAGELYSAVRARRPALLFRPTNLIIAGTGISYIALVAWLTPQYFTIMLPYLHLTYQGFDMPWAMLIESALPICLLYMAPLFFIAAPLGPFTGKVVCWFWAAIAIVALQDKGWINHYYPALFFGNFLFAALLASLAAKGFEALSLKRFALLWALGFVVFALPAYELFATREPQRFQRDYIDRLAAYVEKYHAAGQPLLVLSFNLRPAFPAVDYLPVTFPFHFHQQWMLPGIVAAMGNAKLEEARAFVMRTTAADIEKYRPPLAVAEADCLAVLKEDAGFRAAWKNYRQVGQIDVQTGGDNGRAGQYTVFARQ